MVSTQVYRFTIRMIIFSFAILYSKKNSAQTNDNPLCNFPSPVPAPVLLAKPEGSPFWFPKAPVYPYYANLDQSNITIAAKCLSTSLELYIKAWLDGKASAEIPANLLPVGTDLTAFKNFKLVHPDQIDYTHQWLVRPATKLDPNGVRIDFPDPNATYLVSPLYAPFGTVVKISGDFPHARFFDIQSTPSFWPQNYRYNGSIGVPEVPLVDADILPEPGSHNPFLPGADRNSNRRHYAVELVMAAGDPTVLNSAFKPPFYRGHGNKRFASGIQYQGAWGAPKSGGHGRGVWDIGSIWIRYYAPDNAQGVLGGVGLPKIVYELPDGREYYIEVDHSVSDAQANRIVKLKPTAAMEPDPKSAQLGWNKEFGIFRAILVGFAKSTGQTSPTGKGYVRDVDRGVSSRGLELAGAAHFEPSATSATYINYLDKGMSCGKGSVVILTGTLPRIAKTRSGESPMQRGQARYWSLVGYAVPTIGELLGVFFNPSQAKIGVPVHAIYDEDFQLDKENNYILVFSRPADRPVNATKENGITWCDWGNRGLISWTVRWLSVSPDWAFDKTPNESLLPPSQADWASSTFDATVLDKNNNQGFLGKYQPIVHYMKRIDFEHLGKKPTANQIPKWK